MCYMGVEESDFSKIIFVEEIIHSHYLVNDKGSCGYAFLSLKGTTVKSRRRTVRIDIQSFNSRFPVLKGYKTLKNTGRNFVFI